MAGRAGAQVIIADEDFLLGGRLNAETFGIGDLAWCRLGRAGAGGAGRDAECAVMPRTTIIGAFDHGIYGAVERKTDHVLAPEAGKPRQILWRIYSKRAMLAAGATERSDCL